LRSAAGSSFPKEIQVQGKRDKRFSVPVRVSGPRRGAAFFKRIAGALVQIIDNLVGREDK
jgi:hypothetical protein